MQAEQVDKLVGGDGRVRADAEGTSENVGRPAWNDADRRHPLWGGRAATRCVQHPVDDLVHRAVAAVDDDDVDAALRRGAGYLNRVAPMVGVLDGQVCPALQSVGQKVAGRRGRRSRVRVDDQPRAPEPIAYRRVYAVAVTPSVPAPVRGAGVVVAL